MKTLNGNGLFVLVVMLLVTSFTISCTSTHALISGISVDKAPMLVPRSDFVALTQNDMTYIFGGCIYNQTINASGSCPEVTNTLHRYSYLSNSWSILTPGPNNRTQYSGAIVGNSLYFVGGRAFDNAIVDTVDVYDIVSGTWSTLPSQGGVTNRSNAAAFAYNDVIYVVGGYDLDYNSLNSTITLNLSASETQFRTGIIPNKLIDAGDCGSAVIGDYAYVFNGFSSSIPDGFCVPLNSFERLDLVNRTWSTLNSTLYRRGLPASGVIGGILYLFGGEGKHSTCVNGDALSYPLSYLAGYDPVAEAWLDGGIIGSNRFRFSGTTYPNDSILLSFGGQGVEDDGLDLSTDADNFFPVLNSVHGILLGTQSAASLTISTFSIALLMFLCMFLQ